jgi:very-short-patch-repair endonuclease
METFPSSRLTDRKRQGKQSRRAVAHLYPKKRKAKHRQAHKADAKTLLFAHSVTAAKHSKGKGMTPAEWEVFSRIRSDPHHQWFAQVPCGPFILDFYCPSTLTVVEIDGIEHATARGIAKDADRTAWLVKNHGLRVLRYSNDDAYLDGDVLAALIINENNSGASAC